MADVSTRDAKLIQYLNEAYGKEKELETALQAHIGMTDARAVQEAPPAAPARRRSRTPRPRAPHQEARRRRPRPADRRRSRARRSRPAKGPLHALRGTGEEEKLLKNAKTEYSEEHEEIATYTAIETFAESVGDKETAKLARSIRRDEERMAELPRATDPELAKGVGHAPRCPPRSAPTAVVARARAGRRAEASVGHRSRSTSGSRGRGSGSSRSRSRSSSSGPGSSGSRTAASARDPLTGPCPSDSSPPATSSSAGSSCASALELAGVLVFRVSGMSYGNAGYEPLPGVFDEAFEGPDVHAAHYERSLKAVAEPARRRSPPTSKRSRGARRSPSAPPTTACWRSTRCPGCSTAGGVEHDRGGDSPARRALEHFLADVYFEREIVAAGVLPERVI